MAQKIEAEQPSYGQSQVLDAAQQSLEQATPTPPLSPDAQAVQQALAGQQPEPPEETPANQDNQQTAEPGGFNVMNRFNLLPPAVNFQAAQAKTPVERDYGMGLFWDILAGESQVDPTARLIASKLTGKRG
jgi:hypothetical protein